MKIMYAYSAPCFVSESTKLLLGDWAMASSTFSLLLRLQAHRELLDASIEKLYERRAGMGGERVWRLAIAPLAKSCK